MIPYFSSPRNQLQAHMLQDRRVLVSFAIYPKWIETWLQSFKGVLVDSGAYSEMNSGASVCLDAYVDFASQFEGIADAIAGLDDISGDYKRSLKNYERVGFPTFHDTDPLWLLDELIPISRERGGWIGIGLKPPRGGKGEFLRQALERIPEDLHVHGWALGGYREHERIDSYDSTRWFRKALDIRQKLPFLTYGEALDLSIKQVERLGRGLHSRGMNMDLPL